MPTWGWIALVGVVAAGVGGAVALSGDDDNDSVVSATTVLVPDDSTVSSELVITAPETEATTEATEAPVATDPPASDTTVIAPPASSDVVAGAPPGITGDRDNAVPLGLVADIGAGWRLQVLEVLPDGAAAVAAENEFNEPPPAGSTFTLVKVALGYYGLNDPSSAFQPTISAVGASNLELESFCGTLPNELDLFVDVFSGGVVVGNLCFVTTTPDATSLQLYAVGDYFESDEVFLRANGTATGVDPMATLTGPQAGAVSTPARLSPTTLSTAVDVGAGWSMTVTGAARDITDLVMAENQFNEPAPAGFRFIGVDVTYAYSGTEPSSAYQVTTKAVGEGNVELQAGCGVISGEIDIFTDVFAGGTVAGTICFVVPSANPSMIVYASADFDTSPVMFAVS